MLYWLEYWWLLPIALSFCVLVCMVGVEGSLLFAPFYAVIFPWLAGVDISPLRAIQIGIFTEIVGMSSSFVGFLRAGLIDFRLALRVTIVGIPAAIAGVLPAYRVPQWTLLVVVAAAMPALAWYIRHPPQSGNGEVSRTRQLLRTVKEGAISTPLCCYASGSLYAGEDAGPARAGAATTATAVLSTVAPVKTRQHHDRRGRAYSYDYRGGSDQAVVGALGGVPTGLIGFGIGVLGVAHLVIRRVPIRIAVGTSHFIILLVTGAAVLAHLFEMGHSGIAPPWNVVAVNVVAVLFGGQLAARLAGRIREHRMRAILVALLIVLAAVTLYRAASLAF